MNEDKQIERVAQELSKQCASVGPKAEILQAESLPYDVSARRYHRITYKSALIPTALLVGLADGYSPLGGGPLKLTQNECFIEIQSFLKRNDVRVPEIYLDQSKDGFLLIEDLGSLPLFQHILKEKEHVFDPILDKVDSPDLVLQYGKSAIDLLIKLQALQESEECVAFQRKPTFEQLRAGGEEFIEFILTPLKLNKKELAVFSEAFDHLSEEVLSHPKVFSHYDFMSHNIHVLSDNELALIDFQDASLESPARDLHALICDRDMDKIFEKDRLRELYNYYKSKSPYGIELSKLYPEYQVLWDTRVAGRFTKLLEVDGREKYGQWIPGTMARVVRGFEKLAGNFSRMGDSLEVLLKKYPTAAEALADKWL